MPKPSLAFEKLSGFSARVFSTFSSAPFFYTKPIAVLLIAALTLPLVFTGGTTKAKAERITHETRPPVSSPPEAFAVHTSSIASLLLTTANSIASNAVSKITEIAMTPKLPVGFENGKVPTLSERLAAAVSRSASTKSAIRNPKSAIALLPPPAGTVLFDFDDDGKADIGRWQGSNTEFKVRNSNGGSYTTAIIGSSAAVAAPGDFDGDGKTDAAVFNAGSWTIKKSSNGATQNTTFGTTGDKPVAADYDGDGTTDIAIFRPSTGTWWILKSSDSSYYSTAFGASTDIPVTGNWDGDAYADIAVYRPSTGYWYVTRSTAGSLAVGWGTSTDIPVPADFDGDNKTDLAVYRPSTGAWWIMKSSTAFNGTHVSHTWGNYGDQPVPADYDGDGEADLAVWRPKTGVWYIAKSSEDFEEFEYHSLGIAGNTAVPSAYLSQVGTTVYGDDMANARLNPKNATGGTNLYSRNFSWGTSLVGLPGRSGLDAGFGISYNSLVWTKLESDMHFDVDQSNVTPGFRLGFPTIEPVYYNEVTAKYSFLMVTPSGGRIEFRNTSVSNIYETADSSYTQLKIKSGQSITTPIEEIDLEVTTTDGTMMTYEWLGGAYRCSQIKDRNGNYITIAHDEDGTLQTVTDTLGRVITVNYDSQLYPTSVTQTWKTGNGTGSNTTHTWASFTYTTKTVSTNFGSLTVVGPPNDTVIKVLQKVTYADGGYTKFTHNGYIQVEKVENFAADNHLLNHVRTNLDAVTGSQSDCPRFSATYSKVDNFNMSGGSPLEIEVKNTVPESDEHTLPGGGTADAVLIKVGMTDHPHQVYSRLYISDTGWSEGLSYATEECIGSVEDETCETQKRYTRSYWTQDDTGVAYMLNPRITDSRVSDGTNTKRTTIDYDLVSGNISKWGRVAEMKTYDADLSTVLKKVETDYNDTTAYTDRRLLALPIEVRSYGSETSGLNLMSRVTYAYDEGGFTDSGLQQNISPVQHDGTNYGSSFVTGRGNVTSTTRWNVEYSTNSTYSITSSTKYNTAGSPVAQVTPWNGTNTRTVRIGYADNFNSTVSGSTYAYPTALTDPAGSSLGDSSHSSTVKYRYDIGANVEANSPEPAGNTYGKKTKRVYDSSGRLERDSVYINTTEYAYTRYEYPSSGIQSKVYSTLIDTDSDGADTDDEVLSETFTDGAGRVRLSRVPHTFNTNGTTATWAGTVTEYDILGRVTRQSVPTEVNSSWAATGDDATRGFLWTYQKYDWMNRVVRKINTDGIDQTSLNDSDILISFEGCGCAGGFVTTIEGELVPRTDTTGNARRKQKAHTDILGRTFKTETFEWDGTTPYATIVNTFNGRDQVTLSRHYAGSASSTPFQDTTATFDGHGRLISSHTPQQRDSSNNLKYTTYSYNPDDSILSVTDGRGVETNYEYNSRGLVAEIAWAVPGESGIADPTDVTFAYDNLGNRTLMDDGPGTVEYSYDSLSRMTSELREFDDEISGAPEDNNGYKLEYTYHLGGTLKSLKEPFGVTVNYSADKVGRLVAVAPSSSFGGVSTFASNAQYRAWGALKHLEYANGLIMDQTFDSRLQPATYSLATSSATVMSKTYSYNADSRLRHVDDAVNGKFDRLNSYDHRGRIYQGKSSAEANGSTTSNPFNDRPYLQTYTFDAFGNLKNRENKLWHPDSNLAQNYTFTNNRITNSSPNAFAYDNDGRVVQTPYMETIAETSYDAAGRIDVHHTKPAPTEHEDKVTRHYDGDGREAKRVTDRCRIILPEDPEDPCTWEGEQKAYYVRSTVLGGVAVIGDGRFVYAGGMKLAELTKRVEFTGGPTGTTYDSVNFHHADAAGVSQRVTRNAPEALLGQPSSDPNYIDPRHGEFDAMGNNVGLITDYSPQYIPSDPNMIPIEGEHPMFIDGQRASFSLDGMSISAQQAQMLMGTLGGAYSMFMFSSYLPSTGRLGNYRVRVQDGNRSSWHSFGNDLNAAVASAARYSGSEIFAHLYVDHPMATVSWGPSRTAIQTGSQTRHPLVTQAVRDAREILSGLNDCSRFFGLSEPILQRVADRIDEIVGETPPLDTVPVVDALGAQLTVGLLPNDPNNTTTGIRMSSAAGGGVSVQNGNLHYRTFDSAIVNTRGPFMTSGRFGGYTGRAGRALAILHEVAHMIRTGVVRDSRGRITGSQYLIPDDGVAPNQSVTNTETIKQKCKKELDALPQ